MHSPSRSALFLVSVFAAGSALAGAAPDSTSKLNGYFLGYADYAYISTQHSSKYLTNLRSHCSNRGKVWALGSSMVLRCQGFRLIREGGDGPVYEMKLSGRKSLFLDSSALLLSTKPFTRKNWVIRELSAEEIQVLQDTPALQDEDYIEAKEKIVAGQAFAIESNGGVSITYIAPWRGLSNVHDDESAFLILQRKAHDIVSKFEERGRIVGYSDLDRDGIPELQISEKCDGVCQRVISIKNEPRVVIEIGRH